MAVFLINIIFSLLHFTELDIYIRTRYVYLSTHHKYLTNVIQLCTSNISTYTIHILSDNNTNPTMPKYYIYTVHIELLSNYVKL
jgi:hypothetical protein